MLEGKRGKFGVRIAIFLTVLIPVFCSTGLAVPNHAHWGTDDDISRIAYPVDDERQGAAQSFVADATETITAIKGEYIKRTDSDSNLEIEIRTGSSDEPNMAKSGFLATATIDDSEIWDMELNGWPEGESGTVWVTLSPSVKLTSGSTYWIVWRGTKDADGQNEFLGVVSHGNHESSGMGFRTFDDDDTWTQIPGAADFVYEFDVESPGGGHEIDPNDMGPAFPPENLYVLVGSGWVDISWDESPEEDIAEDGYRLYRRVVQIAGDDGEGGSKVVGEPVFSDDYEVIASGGGTWFHDSTVGAGVIYGYVVTVSDINGNESAPSVEVQTNVPVYGSTSTSGGGGCFLSTAR